MHEPGKHLQMQRATMTVSRFLRDLNTRSRVARTRYAKALAKVEVPRRQIESQFSRLGRAHRGSDRFPFCRQTREIVRQSGEIAIDHNGAATRLVSPRIFQRRD
jgi:hemin uptake protein HemP